MYVGEDERGLADAFVAEYEHFEAVDAVLPHTLHQIIHPSIRSLPIIETPSSMSRQSLLGELTADIEHSRIRELIRSHKDLNGLISGSGRGNGEVRDQEYCLKQHEQRRWLIRKGRKYLIDFDNEERREMNQYFNSLDEKRTGSIGID